MEGGERTPKTDFDVKENFDVSGILMGTLK